MKIFFDTEFMEDGKKEFLQLISIGMVREDGEEYYACNIEADLDQANDWVKENVITKLPEKPDDVWKTKKQMAEEILEFCGDDPEFFAYFCSYDWVLFCWIFGAMVDLPKGYPMFCMDLKQLAVEKGDPQLPPDPEDEHDALVDARWTKEAYEFLMSGWKKRYE